MNKYNGLFTYVYEHFWPAFGRNAAALVLDYYQHTEAGKSGLPVLDLCCGTGDLANLFLQHDYAVTGVDFSPDMLAIARQKNAEYIEAGSAEFIEADVADFQLEQTFGLVVSTYDSFNHLPNIEHVKRTLKQAASVLAKNGRIIFDMNTERGLRQLNNIYVMEQPDAVVVTRSLFDARNACSLMRITGFVNTGEQCYERFEQSLTNHVYNLREITAFLRNLGFSNIVFTRADDLCTPISNPEDEDRVFIIAGRD